MNSLFDVNVVGESSKCAWNTGSECSGRMAERKMFADQLVVPVCDHHFEEHAKVMVLTRAYSQNIEAVVELTSDERAERFKQLTEHSDVTSDLMRSALEKVGHDAPEDENLLVQSFAESFL